MADGGVRVGKGYVVIYPKIDVKGFHKQLGDAAQTSGSFSGKRYQNAFNSSAQATSIKPLEKSLEKFGIKSVTIGSVVGNVVTGALGAIKNLSGSAVERLDTLHQFPKVMSALGYSTEEADKSIKQMQEHLMGLPTTTADISAFVKGISAAGIDLNKATRLGLGFNDMLLAAGASSYDASRAFVQFNQMLSAGKVDMQSWTTLSQLMPAQLGKISEELLGAGKNQKDLYDALQKGTVSWEEFTDAIIKGAEEGGAGFEAFAVTAKEGMGGIGTALTNLKSRFINAMVDILDSIGQDNIKNAINGISQTFGQLANDFEPMIKPILLTLVELANVLADILPYLPELVVGFVAFKATLALAPIITSIVEGLTLFTGTVSLAITTCSGFKGVISSMIAILKALGLSFSALPITWLIAGIVAIVAALVYFFTQTEKGKELWSNFTQTISNLWSGLCEWFMTTMQPVVAGLKAGWEAIKKGAIVVFNALRVAWLIFCEAFNIGFKIVSVPFILAWEVIKATVTLIIEGIKVAWEAFCAIFAPVFEVGAMIVTALITTLQGAFQIAIDIIQAIWNGLCTFFAPAFEVGAAIVTTTINAIQTVFTTVVNIVRAIWNGLCTFFAPAFEVGAAVVMAAVNIIGNIFGTVSEGIKTVWYGLGNVLKHIGSSIGSFFTSTIPSTVGGAFQRAKDRAIEKFNSLKDKVKGIVDSVVGFFTGANLEFPHIKLPHFSMTGEFSLTPPSVPHLSVDWYAKGGVFSSPSVIGVGEAGKEAVLPIDHIKPYFHEAAQDMPRDRGNEEIIIEWLEENLGTIIHNYAPTATPREFNRMVRQAI